MYIMGLIGLTMVTAEKSNTFVPTRAGQDWVFGSILSNGGG